MRKSDKKIENQIRDVLTDVCEDTLKGYDGFLWVTHTVNFSSFPQSPENCWCIRYQSRQNPFLREWRPTGSRFSHSKCVQSDWD